MIEPTTREAAPAGYRLGDPIALEDLLALPPDGRRYTRDAQGRLALMSPDNAAGHGYPITELRDILASHRPTGWKILQERWIAFDPIYDLRGRVLPPSRLGVRTIGPDLAVYSARPKVVAHSPGGRAKVFSPRGLVLAAEVLSPSTRQSDLGRGKRDDVDRWRTFLANQVPEYWVLNADTEPAGLPPRSGLFVANVAGEWRALEVEAATPAPGARRVHGLTPVHTGLVRSRAVPGLTLDLAALWAELDLLEEEDPA